MNKQIAKERRAISGAIMALILIGIAVVAGIVVFTAFNTSSGTAGIRNAFQVDTLSLVNADGEDSAASEELHLSATIKNTGSKAITEVKLVLMVDGYEWDGAASQPTDHVEEHITGLSIAPGESVRVEMNEDEGSAASATNQVVIDESVDINLGRSIPIHIIATLVDGSEVDITTRAIIQ